MGSEPTLTTETRKKIEKKAKMKGELETRRQQMKYVQMTLSRVIDKMVVDEGWALQPCRYRLFTHMSCIILYPYST